MVMRMRFRPRRAMIFALLVAAYLLWSGLLKLPRLSAIHFKLPDVFSFSGLDQTHSVATLAVIGITIVGIVKLLIRRY